jgi:hypothetical protein
MNLNQGPEPLDAPATAIDEQKHIGHRRGDERNRRVDNLSKSSVTCIMPLRFNDDGDAAASPAAARRLPPQLANPAQ